MRRGRATYLERGAWVVAAGLFAAQVVAIATSPERSQWDMRVYYYAGIAADKGLDAYDHAALYEVAPKEAHDNLPTWLYPPHMLALWDGISELDYPVVYYGWLFFKVLCALLVAWFGFRFIPASPARVLFPLLLVVGLNGALPADLRAGNVALVETALMTAAALAFLRYRDGAFALLACAGGAAKFMLAGFVGLLLFNRPPRWVLVSVSLIVFASLVALVGWIDPVAWDRFTSRDIDVAGTGRLDPNLRTFVSELLRLSGIEVTRVLGWTAWALAAIPIGAVTIRSLLRRIDDDRLTTIGFAFLGFVMVVPRLPMYAYSVALWPFAIGLASRRWSAWSTLLSLAALTPTFYISRFVFGRTDTDPTTWLTLGWDYLGWLAVAGLWATLVQTPGE